jgi:hypothetical protein
MPFLVNDLRIENVLHHMALHEIIPLNYFQLSLPYSPCNFVILTQSRITVCRIDQFVEWLHVRHFPLLGLHKLPVSSTFSFALKQLRADLRILDYILNNSFWKVFRKVLRFSNSDYSIFPILTNFFHLFLVILFNFFTQIWLILDAFIFTSRSSSFTRATG